MKRVLTLFPTGIVACVSDSFNIFRACKDYWGGELKELILSRPTEPGNQLVIRPDSGDPVDIICGVKWGISDEDGQYYRESDLFEREGDGDVPSLDIHIS